MSVAGHAPGIPGADSAVKEPDAAARKVTLADKRFQLDVNDWVDSVYEALSDTQRLGQLFMVAAFGLQDKPDEKLEALIRDYNLGGLIFMKGQPMRQARLTNHYQSLAKTPLLIAMDAEWGLAMRLDSTQKYPYQMTLGAIQDNRLIYEMGKQIARQCNALGVHISFSPVVDINNNAANPVIGHRSFGESKEKVAARAIAYMQGLQDQHVLACAKHFPGHGDTDADSHTDLPVIKADAKRLDSLELYPFRRLIQEGVGSVMVAHLSVPALDPDLKTASTLSPKIVTRLLRDELKFKGLVFTDALNMKGVANLYPPGEVDAMALLAGNDVLLYSMDVPTAIGRIQAAIGDGRIKWKQLEVRIKKIIAAKYWAGLHQYQPVNTVDLAEKLNPAEAGTLQQKLFEQAVTLVRDVKKIVPIKKPSAKTLYIGIGQASVSREAYEAYALFHSTDYFQLPAKADEAALRQLGEKLATADAVVLSWHLPTQKAGQLFGLDTTLVARLRAMTTGKQIIQLVYGNPYSLKYIDFGDVVVCGYEEHPAAFKAVANALFGSTRFQGSLPVSVGTTLKSGYGLRTDAGYQLKWEHPAGFGVSPATLGALDSIMLAAIRLGAMPGGQLIVAKGHQVFYAKAFGTLAGNPDQPATLSTLYDLASVTKIAASATGLMQLYDAGRLPIDSSLGFFLPELAGTDKAGITLRELLSHQSGLPAYLPFWKKTTDKKGLSKALYRKTLSDSFPLWVADSLFLRADMRDSLWKWVVEAPLSGRGSYRYSDLGYHLVWRLLQRHWGGKPEQMLDSLVYSRLSMFATGYNPLLKFPQDRIAPTENDREFRKQQLQGYVHDQFAAIQSGIAGHAGLFGTAADLVRLYVPAIRGGTGSVPLIWQQTTLDLFTSPQFTNNRRGLCFDKPETERGKGTPTAPSTPGSAFGHTGFTGTAVWVDPKNELIFVFVSNRVYPDATNAQLLTLNVRTQLQEVVYQCWNNRPSLPKSGKPAESLLQADQSKEVR